MNPPLQRIMDHDSPPPPTEQQVCVEIVTGNDDLKINFVSSVVDEEEEENIKEKRKAAASSAKKPPKAPRSQTHRAFSLDAADQKLIRELAMIKRARMERTKSLLLQKKASKASSSSHSTLFAMIFTIVVFIVVLFQGMSCQISCGTFQGSPPPLETNESGLIFIHEELNPSAHDSV